MGHRQIEWLLRTQLATGLQIIRDNPTYIDEMFPDLTPASVQQLKDWLQITEVGILLSYPRQMDLLPCWVLHMVGETPVSMPIGNMFQQEQDAVSGALEMEEGEYVRKAYQIITLTTSPDITLVLTVMLQHILKSLRQDLINAGFYEVNIAQVDDLQLKVDILPDYAYTRVTYITVLVEDSFIALDLQGGSVNLGSPRGFNPLTGTISVDFSS